jgi:hypothetical protein
MPIGADVVSISGIELAPDLAHIQPFLDSKRAFTTDVIGRSGFIADHVHHRRGRPTGNCRRRGSLRSSSTEGSELAESWSSHSFRW